MDLAMKDLKVKALISVEPINNLTLQELAVTVAQVATMTTELALREALLLPTTTARSIVQQAVVANNRPQHLNTMTPLPITNRIRSIFKPVNSKIFRAYKNHII